MPRPLLAPIPHITPRLGHGPSAGFGQLRPRPPCSSTPLLWRDAGHYSLLPKNPRKNSLLAAVFHVFVMFDGFRVQPCSTICVVGQDGRPRGIKARAVRTTTEMLTYDFGHGLTWLCCERHCPVSVLEHCYTQQPWEKDPGLWRPLCASSTLTKPIPLTCVIPCPT
jgi:hypothetical protein